MLIQVIKLFHLSHISEEDFLDWQEASFVIICPTPVLFSRGHPDGPESLQTLPHATLLAEKRQRGPWRRRGKRRLSADQHVYSLQHGEGSVGSQGLGHGPGTVITDSVALEAEEARKRHITNGSHSGGLNPHHSVTHVQGEAAPDLSEKGLSPLHALTAHCMGTGDQLALPSAALALGFPLGL